MWDQEIELTVSCDFHLICQYGGEEIECTRIYCHSHFVIQGKWRQGFPSLPIVPLSLPLSPSAHSRRKTRRRRRRGKRSRSSKVSASWSHFNLFIFQGNLFPLRCSLVSDAIHCVHCEIHAGRERVLHFRFKLIISLFSCFRESTDSSHVLYM